MGRRRDYRALREERPAVDRRMARAQGVDGAVLEVTERSISDTCITRRKSCKAQPESRAPAGD